MIADTKILVPDIPTHYEGVQQSLTEMGISYMPVTIHTSAGTQRAIRISMTACIALATIHLIQPN